MAGIYLNKLTIARQTAEEFLARETQGTYWFQKDGRWLTLAAWPASRIADAAGVLGLFSLMFLAGLFRPRFLDIDTPRAFVLMALALAALMNFVESAITMAMIVLQYSNIYLFGLVFAGLFLYQSALDAGWRVVGSVDVPMQTRQ